MNDTEKVIKSLQEMRDATAKQAERAARDAEAAQKKLKSLDHALSALVEDGSTGLRVPAGKTIGDAVIKDIVLYAMHDKDVDFTLDDLVQHDEFLASLVNPVTRSRNLRNLWEENITALLRVDGYQVPAPGFPDHDVALNIAENKSKETGLALTTVSVSHEMNGKNDSVSVHILCNNQQDKMLIVGEKISSRLRDAFRKANIHYVDRNAATAKDEIKAAMKEVLGPAPHRFTEDRLLDAFKYRNAPENEKDEQGVDFVSALISPKFEPMYAKYIVRPK